jgi:hypothetical protein
MLIFITIIIESYIYKTYFYTYILIDMNTSCAYIYIYIYTHKRAMIRTVRVESNLYKLSLQVLSKSS